MGPAAPYAGPMGEDRRLDSTGDPGHSEDAPRPWAPAAMPDDAARLGLDRNIARRARGSTSRPRSTARRLSHRLIAWALLRLFGAGVLLQLRDVLPFG